MLVLERLSNRKHWKQHEPPGQIFLPEVWPLLMLCLMPTRTCMLESPMIKTENLHLICHLDLRFLIPPSQLRFYSALAILPEKYVLSVLMVGNCYQGVESPYKRTPKHTPQKQAGVASTKVWLNYSGFG